MAMTPRVFVVDSDPQVRRDLRSLLEAGDLIVETFPSVSAFLERGTHDGPSCLVLDVRRLELDGADIRAQLAHADAPIPIVFLKGRTDASTPSSAVRDDWPQAIGAVGEALARAAGASRDASEPSESAARLARLSSREREVMELVAAGRLNKQIAVELGISEETVKVHRGHAMRKLQVDSVPALVRLFDRARS
jgi:FixJ family two-component response regulator